MLWPKKIHTREMLNSPQHFSNSTIQMLFFNEHCHGNSICFKSFLYLLFFIYRRDRPLENLWGGSEVPKKYLRKGKLNKKNSYTPMNP